MANAWKWILGALTGGLSLLGDVAGNAGFGASKSGGSKSSGSDNSYDDLVKQLGDLIQANGNENPSSPSFMSHQNTDYMNVTPEGNGLADWIAGQTGSRLTTAQQQANLFNRAERIEAQDFNHNEAVDARLWDQYVAQNKYQWETQSMLNAGINPAMAYGGGNLVPTAAGSAQASISPASSVSPGSVGDPFSALMALVRMPLELKSLQASIEESRSRKAKNVADTKGQQLQNEITESTMDKLIELAGLTNDEVRERIKNIAADTTDKQALAELHVAQKITEGLNQTQMRELLPLIKEGYELENQYNTVRNRNQQREIDARIDEIEAHIVEMFASARLMGQQAKYAGKMSLGNLLGWLLTGDGDDGTPGGSGDSAAGGNWKNALKNFYKYSPFGGLYRILANLGNEE